MTRQSSKTPTRITTGQMRRMHALLRDHGIVGDHAVHAYLRIALETDEDVSREDLTREQYDVIVGELDQAEVAHTPTDARLAKLREPFPDVEVGKLPRVTCKDCRDDKHRKRCDAHRWVTRCRECGNSHSEAAMHIDYVGHADVTARLLAVDPGWTWTTFTTDEINALPPQMRDGIWIHLTVLGVTRPGFGSTDGKTGGNGVKEAIGDALRNAAMRFGVALDLWAKGDREWAHVEKHGAERMNPDDPPPVEQTPEQAWRGPSTAQLLLKIDGHAQALGQTYEDITAKFRAANGGMTLDDLDRAPAHSVANLEAALADWVTKAQATGETDKADAAADTRPDDE